MKRTLLSICLLLLACSVFGADTNSPAPASGSLTVYIYGLRSTDGHVRVALFPDKSGFPSDSKKALIVGVIKGADGRAGVRFDNIPPGTYAVACYHDENDNKELDEDQHFKPTEGYGISRDAKGTFGPPKFGDAKFEFSGASQTLNINLHYPKK